MGRKAHIYPTEEMKALWYQRMNGHERKPRPKNTDSRCRRIRDNNDLRRDLFLFFQPLGTMIT
jgi:hypothetical protein